MTQQGTTVKFIDNRYEITKAMEYAEKAALRKAGRIVAKEAKQNVPAHTGMTRKSLGVKTWKPYGTGRLAKGDVRGRLSCRVGYWSSAQLKKKGRPKSFAKAAWIEKGTKFHSIAAGIKSSRGDLRKITQKRALANNKTGVIYGKKVNHPGARGSHALENAAKTKRGAVKACAEEYYRKLSELHGKPETYFSQMVKEMGGEGEVEDDV